MLTVAAPDAAEARCNATFEALMWSMARPGVVRELPGPGLAPIVEALIDRECAVYTDSAALGYTIADTGAVLASDLAMADHLFLEELTWTGSDLAAIRCGNALYPDDGATLVAKVAHGAGYRLRFTGPGIDGYSDVTIALPPGFWAWRAQLCAYPEGFDLLLVDGTAVIGIPRSTQIEVL